MNGSVRETDSKNERSEDLLCGCPPKGAEKVAVGSGYSAHGLAVRVALGSGHGTAPESPLHMIRQRKDSAHSIGMLPRRGSDVVSVLPDARIPASSELRGPRRSDFGLQPGTSSCFMHPPSSFAHSPNCTLHPADSLVLDAHSNL